MLLHLVLGCKPPPQAPADYEQLLDYIFAHSGDEDDAELVAGLTNLQAWIDESDTTALVEGNSISVLSESSVETLEGDHKLEGLKGVSLLTDSSYNSTVLMESLTQYPLKRSSRCIPDLRSRLRSRKKLYC